MLCNINLINMKLVKLFREFYKLLTEVCSLVNSIRRLTKWKIIMKIKI